jgi:hypothetical protein
MFSGRKVLMVRVIYASIFRADEYTLQKNESTVIGKGEKELGL